MDVINIDQAFEEEEEEESSGSWATAEGSEGEAAGGEEATTSRGTEEAWGSREKGMHGCAHYRRRCRLVAPCCGEAFWCVMSDSRTH